MVKRDEKARVKNWREIIPLVEKMYGQAVRMVGEDKEALLPFSFEEIKRVRDFVLSPTPFSDEQRRWVVNWVLTKYEEMRIKGGGS